MEWFALLFGLLGRPKWCVAWFRRWVSGGFCFALYFVWCPQVDRISSPREAFGGRLSVWLGGLATASRCMSRFVMVMLGEEGRWSATGAGRACARFQTLAYHLHGLLVASVGLPRTVSVGLMVGRVRRGPRARAQAGLAPIVSSPNWPDLKTWMFYSSGKVHMKRQTVEHNMRLPPDDPRKQTIASPITARNHIEASS